MKNSSTARQEKFLIGPAALDCNRGDQALMWEAIDILRKNSPHCEIAIMSDVYNDPEDKQSRQTRKLGIKVLPALLPNPRRAAKQTKNEIIDSGWSLVKMKIRAALDFAQTCGLVLLSGKGMLARLLLSKERYETYKYLQGCKALVIKGGGYIYAYRGLRWAYYIWFGLLPLMLAQKCGVSVVVLPNSLGPFDTRWGRWLARRVLGRCKVLTAREPESYRVFNTILPGKAKLYPDMAFGLTPENPDWARTELMRHSVPLFKKKCVGITMRPWRFPNDKYPREKYINYVKAFAKLIEHLLYSRYAPVLFAHVIGPHAHEDDRITIRDVLQATSVTDRIFYVDGDYNCRQVKSLYGFMDFMICTRFHSAIFSIAQGVPCLAVSYQGYKATGTMNEIGLEDFICSINNVDGDSLIRAFEMLVAEQQEVKRKMLGYMSVCRERLQDLQELIMSEINSGPS
jgi:colanic acid/amylovoran biosynthesis protein